MLPTGQWYARHLGSLQKNMEKSLMAFAIKRPPPPPLMALISIHFFTPLFYFAIESFLYETDFTPGPSQNYHS